MTMRAVLPAKFWQELWVGAFVLAAIGALVFLAAQVTNLKFFQGSGGYFLVADFTNIGGLTVRSTVKVAGVPVGRVVAIDYLPEKYQARVRLWIADEKLRFPEDSSASINTAGLLGEQFVSITPGGDSEMLPNEGRLEYTQGALVLENLIGQFLRNMGNP
jgi:phospholipid/cholesterol/gamma-HCH transport system substrate-binding protein